MIDSEEMHLFWEPWNSPPKTKRKKNSKKDRKEKNNQITKTNDSRQNKKKKKSSKLKEAKKEKRKGKKKSALGVDQDADTCQTIVKVKPYTTGNPETKDSKKKTKKKKKKVAFDLPLSDDLGKQPKYVCCSLQSSEENTAVTGAVGEGENHPQVTGQNQGQPVHHDSQCPSDDLQSQDLFITQRTFTSPASQTSSSGSSGKAGLGTHTRVPKHTPVRKIANQDPDFYQRKATQKKNTLEVFFSQEEDDDKMDSVFFQTQKESNTKRTKYKSASRHLSVKPKPVNPYLDAPIVADGATSTKPSTVSSVFTQTENFFTTELSSYLSFCQQNTRRAHPEDIKPLDLSLPHRVRCLETSVTETQDDQDRGDGSRETDLEDAEGASHSGRLCSVSSQGKGQKTPSPQSESESKSADTLGSSEDSEAPCRHGRLDLMQFQVRAVQMRLNESFFFKAKGERHSPRPASPLMKLTQGRDVKRNKRL